MSENAWDRFRADHYYAHRAAVYNGGQISHVVMNYRTFDEIRHYAARGVKLSQAETADGTEYKASMDAWAVDLGMDGKARIYGMPVLRTPDIEGWLFMKEAKERRA